MPISQEINSEIRKEILTEEERERRAKNRAYYFIVAKGLEEEFLNYCEVEPLNPGYTVNLLKPREEL